MSSVVPAVGNAISSLMIAVHAVPKSPGQLEAAVERIATELHVKAHIDAPPKATDLGRGLYNLLV